MAAQSSTSDIASSSSSSPPAPLEWNFYQSFGDESEQGDDDYVDVISTMQFDKAGNHLAVGHRSGRVLIFEKDCGEQDSESTSRNELEQLDSVASRPPSPRYRYKAGFQSHNPEFDSFTNNAIEEKIIKVKWCAATNGALFTLSANEKTIKLWKVKDREVKRVRRTISLHPVSSENSLLSEKSSDRESSNVAGGHSLEWTGNVEDEEMASLEEDTAVTKCRRVFAHAHDFQINSLSVNSDWETFLSGDSLRINLWNLEISNPCFNIINTKPVNTSDVRELITAAEFHPFHCNLLAYGSTAAIVRLVDMRQSAICDHGARIFKDVESHSPKAFLDEVAESITDLKFAIDGRFILTRDFMTLKLWDTNMEARPVATYRVHESLRPKLRDLYRNDAIFDKFDCCIAGDRLAFATGSYSNHVRLFSAGSGSEGVTFEASRHQGYDDQNAGSSEFLYDFNLKLLHLAWHPTANLIACAAGNSFFMFHA